MQKGSTKKWQVLNEEAFDRDQIEKIQAAINAPSAAQLDQWEEKHSVPMQLPFTNENVQRWRDEPQAINSADFDPLALTHEREHKKKQFLERYEIPKALKEEHH